MSALEARRAIALALRPMEIPAILMEDEPGPAGESWQDKFFPLLEEHGITDILFYWPPEARIDAAQDELIMLAVKERFQPRLRPRVTLFGHEDAIAEGEADGDTFLEVRDEVGRSSYLGQVPDICRQICTNGLTTMNSFSRHRIGHTPCSQSTSRTNCWQTSWHRYGPCFDNCVKPEALQ